MLSICYRVLWILQFGRTKIEACKEKLADFDALDEVPCPPQMESETFLSQVDLEAPFQADLELEADEFESNNNVQNEPNENDSEPEKVYSIAETLLYLANIRAHLMSLGEDIEAFDSLKKLERILAKKHRRISIQTNKYY